MTNSPEQFNPPNPEMLGRAQFALQTEPTTVPLILDGSDQITHELWETGLSIQEHQTKALAAHRAFGQGYVTPSDSRLKVGHGLLIAGGNKRAVLLAGATGSGKSYAIERMIGNGRWTIDVQPDTREASIRGFVSPMTGDFMQGGLKGSRVALDELGQANSTAGTNLVTKTYLEVNGHEIDSESIAIASTTNFPEEGSDRTKELDAATLGRNAAYILMGDNDREKGKRFRSTRDTLINLPLPDGTLPSAEVRLEIGKFLREFDNTGEKVQEEQTRIIDAIMMNKYFDLQAPDDARFMTGWWETARAAKLMGVTGRSLDEKMIFPEETRLVAPLVLPKSVDLTEMGMDKLKQIFNDNDMGDVTPMQGQIALRQALTLIVDPTVTDAELPYRAFARDDYYPQIYAQFAREIAKKAA